MILNSFEINLANGAMQESFFDQPQYKQPEFDREGELVYSVEECHFLVNEAISRLGRIHVKGEITHVAPRGGATYITLRDAGGKAFVINCLIFQSQVDRFLHLLEVGLEVVVAGRVELYKNGRLSLKIDEIRPSGEGAWKKEFEALKKKLASKGWFEEAIKRPIPIFVKKIGLITSETGEAIHDFTKNIGRYGFQIFFYDVWVEGEKAEKSIVEALHWFSQNMVDLDVLVLIRGGGSPESLVVFHSEQIAEAIRASRIPVITGIGHEKDESIADYVADKRLSTPTAVAVFLRTQREDLMRTLDMLWEDMKEKVEEIMEEQRLLIHSHARELKVSMERVVEANRFSISQIAEKLHRGFGRVFESFASLRGRLLRLRYDYEKYVYASLANVEKAASILSSLNPESVLQRGYSITLNSKGVVMKSYKQVEIGDEAFVRLSEGGFSSRVERKSQVPIFKSPTNSNDPNPKS